MEILSKNQKIFVIAGIIIACVVIVFYYINSTKSVYNYEDFTVDEEESVEVVSDENKETNNMIIHVTGAVKSEGIVLVKENARINDVIEAAGGLLDNADLQSVNLAYAVEDGQKIYIPFIDEGTEGVDDGELVSDIAGKNVLPEEAEGINGKGGLININTASEEKLTELPGIRKFNCFKNSYI